MRVRFRSNFAEDKDPRLEQVLSLLEINLFTPSFVISALKLLLSRYLILDQDALLNWENEAEEFVQEAESDHWEYNVLVNPMLSF
jgi:hypothetical protein